MTTLSARKRLQKVRRAFARVSVAQLRAQLTVQYAYPVGCEINWEKGGAIQVGRVVAHSNYGGGRRIRVENYRTGKTYWIDSYFWR